MGCIYSFWKKLHKAEKKAKGRYIQTFYNLQFRSLVYYFPSKHALFLELLIELSRLSKLILTCNKNR